MIKTLLISLSFAAIIAATGRYLLAIESEYSSQLQKTSEQEHYTHQFKQFALTQTSDLGEMQSAIYSPNTRSLVTEQKTLMESPKVTIYRDQEPPMIITAESAEVLHQKNITLLNNNVELSMPDKNNNKVVMTTEQLTLDNATQSAVTDLPATIVHSKGNMSGTGLEFNPHTKQIKFLNKVRGIYEH